MATARRTVALFAICLVAAAGIAAPAAGEPDGEVSPAQRFQAAMREVRDGVLAVGAGDYDVYSPEIVTIEERLADLARFVRTDPEQQSLLRTRVLRESPVLRGLESRQLELERRLKALRREAANARSEAADVQDDARDEAAELKRKADDLERWLDEGEARADALDREIDRLEEQIRLSSSAVERDFKIAQRNEKANSYNHTVKENRKRRRRYNAAVDAHNAFVSRAREKDRKAVERGNRILARVEPRIAATERELRDVRAQYDRTWGEVSRRVEQERIPELRGFLTERLDAMRAQKASLDALAGRIDAWVDAGLVFIEEDLDAVDDMIEARRAVCTGRASAVASRFCSSADRAHENAREAVRLLEEHGNRALYDRCRAPKPHRRTLRLLEFALPRGSGEPAFESEKAGACAILALRSAEIDEIKLIGSDYDLDMLATIESIETLSVPVGVARAGLLPRFPKLRNLEIRDIFGATVMLLDGPDCERLGGVELRRLVVEADEGPMSLECIPHLAELRELAVRKVVLDETELAESFEWPPRLRELELSHTGVEGIDWLTGLPGSMKSLELRGAIADGFFRRRKIRKTCKALGIEKEACTAEP